MGGRSYTNTVRTNRLYFREKKLAKSRAERRAKQKALDRAMETITIINEPEPIIHYGIH